ncbi:MAG: HAD-IIIA family hydrolase [Bacteroidales bacterium]|nr:HAD-IIIA family hydrolase [Bacteroidales bacterium]
MIYRHQQLHTGGALFLDRDGVLNRLIVGDYVRTPDQLEVLPGVPEAIAICNRHFKHVFIVTNQQCIGKGYITVNQLESIHRKLIDAIEAAGGHIDHIYFCPDLASSYSPNRKPEIGMALQARHDYPDVIFMHSIMAGDSMTDMRFGHRCGMQTVLIGSDSNAVIGSPKLVNFSFPTLLQFAKSLEQ